MGIFLEVDAPAWRAHLNAMVHRFGEVVPVCKGNGYGFGLRVLADEAARLSCPVLAVGTEKEAVEVADRFAGEILVLLPWRPTAEPVSRLGSPSRLLRTVAHLDVLADLVAFGADTAAPAVGGIVVEMESPLHRHGIAWPDLDLVRDLVRQIPFAGIGLHLPLAGDRLRMAMDAGRRLADAGIGVPALWVSHLTPDQADALHRATGVPVRQRVGTRFWLGAPHTFRARAHVLDVHTLPRGSAIGYRNRHVAAGAKVAVVAGGTSHGVGIRSTMAGHSTAARLRAAAVAGLEAAGLALSPFSWHGHRLNYADTPHMQVTMVHLPRGTKPPRIGDVMDVATRMTTTNFDEVVFHNKHLDAAEKNSTEEEDRAA